MLRRYELTDQEWEQIAPFLPAENTGKRGCPSKDNRLMLNAMVWLARSGAPWRDIPERYGPWESAEAELEEISLDASIVQAHQHSAGAKQGASKRNRP